MVGTKRIDETRFALGDPCGLDCWWTLFRCIYAYGGVCRWIRCSGDHYSVLASSIDMAKFWEAVKESAVTTTAILIIIAAAKVFGKALALYRVPQDISAFIAMNIDGPIIFILIVSAVLLVMGLVFETLSMILIMTPVLLPAAMGLGFDPIWFGIYMVIMVECALITPPVGLNLYVIQSVAKVSLGEVASGVWPFLIMMLVCVFVLYIVPDLALYIPFKW